MTRDIITIPNDLLDFTDFDWDIEWRSQGLGDNLAGQSVAIQQAAPRWVGSVGMVLVGDKINRWNSIRWHAQGVKNIYRLRVCNPLFDIGTAPANGITFSNGQTFNTGQGFEYDPFYICTAGAAKGATTITVDVPTGFAPPKAGQIMSCKNDWLIGVTSSREVAAQQYEITVRPGLRAAIPAGGPVMMAGTGRFLATEDAMGRGGFGVNHVARPTLSMAEYLNRD